MGYAVLLSQEGHSARDVAWPWDQLLSVTQGDLSGGDIGVRTCSMRRAAGVGLVLPIVEQRRNQRQGKATVRQYGTEALSLGALCLAGWERSQGWWQGRCSTDSCSSRHYGGDVAEAPVGNPVSPVQVQEQLRQAGWAREMEMRPCWWGMGMPWRSPGLELGLGQGHRAVPAGAEATSGPCGHHCTQDS